MCGKDCLYNSELKAAGTFDSKNGKLICKLLNMCLYRRSWLAPTCWRQKSPRACATFGEHAAGPIAPLNLFFLSRSLPCDRLCVCGDPEACLFTYVSVNWLCVCCPKMRTFINIQFFEIDTRQHKCLLSPLNPRQI